MKLLSVPRGVVDVNAFNDELELPYSLRVEDFQMAMQDVYDFLYDVDSNLVAKSLPRFESMLRPAILSGILSDLLTSSLARHSRSLTENDYFNGHPDLIVDGKYPGDAVKAGEDGVEVKCTRKKGGAVDTHGARAQWMCVFVYAVDSETEPASARKPLTFTEVYLARVEVEDFRKNPRSELGTRTATLHREGVKKLRAGWLYRLDRELS